MNAVNLLVTTLALMTLIDVPGESESRQVQADPQTQTIGHPGFALLDADGNNVLRSGGPVSTMRTCGACHNTDYIASHNYHALAGADERVAPGTARSGREWDTSPGPFGRWDPLLYRYLSPADDANPDLDAVEWTRVAGARHPGGGPAPAELNCFLCHIPRPDNAARIEALQSGGFEWAATATLSTTGLVARTPDGWSWNPRRFDPLGRVSRNELALSSPSSDNCGLCHGLTHTGDEPLRAFAPTRNGASRRATETTGLVFSSQRVADSGMNVAGKDSLARPWDVHAERLLECSSCHFAANDPAYASGAGDTPGHLAFDARKQDVGEFLLRPDHNLAKGHSTQGTVADALDGGMRGCASCHDATESHAWLPYTARHMERLMCESCHVPRVFAPARSVTDWTVLTPDRGPRVEYRGIEGTPGDPAALVRGYTPVLMARDDGDGPRVGPYNLVTTWFWIAGNPPRPVRLHDLEAAYFDGGAYHADIVAALDENDDGALDDTELVLDTGAEVAAVATRLEAIGVDAPSIRGEVQPYGLHHGVAPGSWATRDCETCHSDESAVGRGFVLAAAGPAGVAPRFVGDASSLAGGEIVTLADGGTTYTPALARDGFYVLGHDRWKTGDVVGIIAIAAALLGAALHGTLRILASRRRQSA